MSKVLKPERVAGIVALSYLVLIPIGAAVAYRKLQIMERDVDEMWGNQGLPERGPEPLFDKHGLRRLIGR